MLVLGDMGLMSSKVAFVGRTIDIGYTFPRLSFAKRQESSYLHRPVYLQLDLCDEVAEMRELIKPPVWSHAC